MLRRWRRLRSRLHILSTSCCFLQNLLFVVCAFPPSACASLCALWSTRRASHVREKARGGGENSSRRLRVWFPEAEVLNGWQVFQSVQFVHLPKEILETLRFNTPLSATSGAFVVALFFLSLRCFIYLVIYLFNCLFNYLFFLNGNNFNKHASRVEPQATSKTAAAWQWGECETQLINVFPGTTCAEHMTTVGGDICPGLTCPANSFTAKTPVARVAPVGCLLIVLNVERESPCEVHVKLISWRKFLHSAQTLSCTTQNGKAVTKWKPGTTTNSNSCRLCSQGLQLANDVAAGILKGE